VDLGTSMAACILIITIGTTVIKIRSKKVCNLHSSLMSDLASIKNAMVSLTVYVMKEANHEGRDLQQEIITAMMKK